MQEVSAETTMPRTRPEVELLLCCARTHVDEETARRIESLLLHDLDWIFIFRTVLSKGTLPLLYRTLSTVCPGAVPQATLAQLRKQFEINARRNVSLTEELLRLIGLFEARGIPALPFKGPALAALAYGDLALRQFCDVDVLVREGDVESACETLRAEGYRLYDESQEAGPLASLIAGRKDLGFVSGDGKVLLELHWRFTPRYFRFFDLENLWKRLEPVALAGETVRSLRAEDLLLLLTMHGSKHYWERLDWVGDVAELLRARPGLDWSDTLEQAGALGTKRMLFIGLTLARDLLGAPVPDHVTRSMQADPVAGSLAAEAGARLFAEADAPSETLTLSHVTAEGIPLDLIPFHLMMRERFGDKVREARFLANDILAPSARDRALVRLPKPLSFFYYFIRPIRLFEQYGLRPFRYVYQVSRHMGTFTSSRK